MGNEEEFLRILRACFKLRHRSLASADESPSAAARRRRANARLSMRELIARIREVRAAREPRELEQWAVSRDRYRGDLATRLGAALIGTDDRMQAAWLGRAVIALGAPMAPVLSRLFDEALLAQALRHRLRAGNALVVVLALVAEPATPARLARGRTREAATILLQPLVEGVAREQVRRQLTVPFSAVNGCGEPVAWPAPWR